MDFYGINDCRKRLAMLAYVDWSDKITLHRKFWHAISQNKAEFFTRIQKPLVRRTIGWAVKRWRLPNFAETGLHVAVAALRFGKKFGKV